MKLSLLDYLCCSRPAPIVTFQHTKIEFIGISAYIDLFCYLDRTVIMDQDYLSLVTSSSPVVVRKIPIMREPGNVSGVSRVTFPSQSGIYSVNYIRREKDHETTLAQISIAVKYNKEPNPSFDTEICSPRLLTISQNNTNSFNLKNCEKSWTSTNIESTSSVDLCKFNYLNSSQ